MPWWPCWRPVRWWGWPCWGVADVRDAERLALAVALLLLALLCASPVSAGVVIGVSAVVLVTHGRPWASVLTWLAAPLPFLAASTLAGWWTLWRTGDGGGAGALASVYAHGGERLLQQALRAAACTAAVGVAVLSVPLPVAAAAARRLRIPAMAVEVLVLSLRVVHVAGRTLRARVRSAPLRFGAHSAPARLRTSVGLAATMASVTHHRARRLDAMMEMRGTPDWAALASLVPTARTPVLLVIGATAVAVSLLL